MKSSTYSAHFGPYDAGWVSCKFAQALRKLEGPRPFNAGPAPLNSISNTARIVLLSDWGTGVPRAQDVAESARRFVEEGVQQGRDVHVVHLGDTYYAGYKFEYEERFLQYWPVNKDEADRIPSYAIPGNHDMYSGGHDYYDFLLADPRFRRQKQCSFFGLENAYWQILALDTAYTEGTLHDPQLQWILQKRTGAPYKAGILFSHHQPFSPFRESYGQLLEQLKPVTEQKLITGWWWGHEHRCHSVRTAPGGTVSALHRVWRCPGVCGQASQPTRSRISISGFCGGNESGLCTFGVCGDGLQRRQAAGKLPGRERHAAYARRDYRFAFERQRGSVSITMAEGVNEDIAGRRSYDCQARAEADSCRPTPICRWWARRQTAAKRWNWLRS